MFQFIRAIFRKPTWEEVLSSEDRLAEKIYQKSRREAIRWAKHPTGYEFSIYVGFPNNRVVKAIESKIRDNICKKYNCLYSFRVDGYLKFTASYDTEKLINDDRLGSS